VTERSTSQTVAGGGIFLIAAILSTGCAAKPEPIRHYPTTGPAESLAILRTRMADIKAVRGEATLTLTDPKGQTIHLDGAYLLAPPNRARLRAWKLGTAVFDLTIREDGAWAYLPREEAKPAAPNLRKSLNQWLDLLAGGEFFAGDAEIKGNTLILTRPQPGDMTLRCTVDRPTLTPRLYELFDPQGVKRFTLTMSDYRPAGENQVWPMKIVAESEGGTIQLDTRDVEVNGELPAATFRPPSRAEKLP
jgi:outer membrane lipoprotein-sorting protein